MRILLLLFFLRSEISRKFVSFVFTFLSLALFFSMVYGETIKDLPRQIIIKSKEQRGEEVKVTFDIEGLENKNYNLFFYIKDNDKIIVPKFVFGPLINLKPSEGNFIVWQYRKDGIYDISSVELILDFVPDFFDSGRSQMRIARLGRNYWTIDNTISIHDSTSIVPHNFESRLNWGSINKPGFYTGKPTNKLNGILFNSYALLGDSLVCSKGWKVPTISDYLDLMNFLNKPEEYFNNEDYLVYNNLAGMGTFWFIGQSQKGCLSPYGSEYMVDDNWFWWTSSNSSRSNEWLAISLDNNGNAHTSSISKNAGLYVRCVCSFPSELIYKPSW